MNPGDTTQLVTTPRPSAALPPAPVCLGSSPTARPGPVRRVRNRPTPDPPPHPEVGAPGAGEGEPRDGGGGPSLCSLSARPVHPQVRPRGLLGPRGASAPPPAAPPGAVGTASVPGPPAWCCPAGRRCPPRPRPLLSAQAPRPRRSLASCRGVTVSAPSPGRHPWGHPLPVPAAPQPQPSPLPTLLPLLSPQELGAGVLGLPGPAAAGAVGEAFGAGLEPATSPHPRAWEITARDLRPRGRPARPCRAQVPVRDGGGGQGAEAGKLQEALWGERLGRAAHAALSPPCPLPQ